MYLAKVDDVIYVLHCFEKDSTKTSNRDLEIARNRLSEIRAEIERNRVELKRKNHGRKKN
jgi:phage-related protein